MAYEIRSNGLKIKTSDGKTILGSDFNVEIKELDEKNRSFWAIASTENPDRDNDVIRTEGWDYKNYMKNNPVGLFAHNYYDHPHFKTNKIKLDKESKQMLFQPIFDTHDQAEITWNQYKNGFMSSFSVGFNPLEHKYIDEKNSWYGGIEFLKQELLEISAVPVPANKEANMLRSMASNENTLAKMGYFKELSKDEKSGILWYPIKDMESYKEPRITGITNGIKAVSAIPLYESKESSIIPVVGYFFDMAIYDEKAINEWMIKNCPKITNKFFVFNENKGITDLEIKEEILDVNNVIKGFKSIFKEIKDEGKSKEKEEKLEGEKDGSESDKTNESQSAEVEESEEATEEAGCGGGKKPKNFVDENFDKAISDLVLNIKALNETVQTFSKSLNSFVQTQKDLGNNKPSNEKTILNENEIEFVSESFLPVSSDTDEKDFEFEIDDLEKIIPDIKNEISQNFKTMIEEIAKEFKNE